MNSSSSCPPVKNVMSKCISILDLAFNVPFDGSIIVVILSAITLLSHYFVIMEDYFKVSIKIAFVL